MHKYWTNFQFLSGFQHRKAKMGLLVGGLTFNSFPDSSGRIEGAVKPYFTFLSIPFRIPDHNHPNLYALLSHFSFNSFPDSSADRLCFRTATWTWIFQFLSGFQKNGCNCDSCLMLSFQFLSGFQLTCGRGCIAANLTFNSFPDSRSKENFKCV